MKTHEMIERIKSIGERAPQVDAFVAEMQAAFSEHNRVFIARVALDAAPDGLGEMLAVEYLERRSPEPPDVYAQHVSDAQIWAERASPSQLAAMCWHTMLRVSPRYLRECNAKLAFLRRRQRHASGGGIDGLA